MITHVHVPDDIAVVSVFMLHLNGNKKRTVLHAYSFQRLHKNKHKSAFPWLFLRSFTINATANK